MYLAPVGGPRFFDDPQLQQCINLGSNGRLFFRGMVTLLESVVRQLSLSSSSITIGFTLAGSDRTAVQEISMNSLHRDLSAPCNAGVPLN